MVPTWIVVVYVVVVAMVAAVMGWLLGEVERAKLQREVNALRRYKNDTLILEASRRQYVDRLEQADRNARIAQ